MSLVLCIGVRHSRLSCLNDLSIHSRLQINLPGVEYGKSAEGQNKLVVAQTEAGTAVALLHEEG